MLECLFYVGHRMYQPVPQGLFHRKTSGNIAKSWLFSYGNSCADFPTMAVYLDCPRGDGQLILCLLSLRVKSWRRRFFSNTRSLGKLSYILKNACETLC